MLDGMPSCRRTSSSFLYIYIATCVVLAMALILDRNSRCCLTSTDCTLWLHTWALVELGAQLLSLACLGYYRVYVPSGILPQDIQTRSNRFVWVGWSRRSS